ncbi:MAG: fibronectin type III domain-containing protein [Ignavibacteria bacterium]
MKEKIIKMALNNLSAARGDSQGEINIQWDAAENAVQYIIEIAAQSNSKEIRWKVIDIISESHYTVKKLKSNKNYFFRITSDDGTGREEFSRKVIKKAP